MRALVWFRRDLRVGDNTALREAAAAATEGVVGVFLISPKQWKQHDEAPCKIDFWLRNLHELSDALRKLNIPLLIKSADSFAIVPGALVGVARRCKCQAVYFNREYEVNESRRDDEATSALTESAQPESKRVFCEQLDSRLRGNDARESFGIRMTIGDSIVALRSMLNSAAHHCCTPSMPIMSLTSSPSMPLATP